MLRTVRKLISWPAISLAWAAIQRSEETCPSRAASSRTIKTGSSSEDLRW
jgi:hypothetical protein